ncbi:uncharacterized protein RAG0_09838 [Rhynchosporium agropyri]|uniref:Uncharacterized protein n=1 Tax=Rhynchosporium agropyri TaxID=914238 RepID=A0A1E1KX77_9HELO|nr:uncharacterized protein RAG0_09838 [Rhynchosporium agropyri]
MKPGVQQLLPFSLQKPVLHPCTLLQRPYTPPISSVPEILTMISNSVEALLALYACTKQLRFIQPAATQQSINCPAIQRLSDPANLCKCFRTTLGKKTIRKRPFGRLALHVISARHAGMVRERGH